MAHRLVISILVSVVFTSQRKYNSEQLIPEKSSIYLVVAQDRNNYSARAMCRGTVIRYGFRGYIQTWFDNE